MRLCRRCGNLGDRCPCGTSLLVCELGNARKQTRCTTKTFNRIMKLLFSNVLGAALTTGVLALPQTLSKQQRANHPADQQSDKVARTSTGGAFHENRIDPATNRQACAQGSWGYSGGSGGESWSFCSEPCKTLGRTTMSPLPLECPVTVANYQAPFAQGLVNITVDERGTCQSSMTWDMFTTPHTTGQKQFGSCPACNLADVQKWYGNNAFDISGGYQVKLDRIADKCVVAAGCPVGWEWNFQEGNWADNLGTPYQCLQDVSTNDSILVKFDGNGDAACASLNSKDCLWMSPQCCAASRYLPSLATPYFACGARHQEVWNITGYDQDGHWCKRARETLPKLNPVMQQVFPMVSNCTFSQPMPADGGSQWKVLKPQSTLPWGGKYDNLVRKQPNGKIACLSTKDGAGQCFAAFSDTCADAMARSTGGLGLDWTVVECDESMLASPDGWCARAASILA